MSALLFGIDLFDFEKLPPGPSKVVAFRVCDDFLVRVFRIEPKQELLEVSGKGAYGPPTKSTA